MSQCWLCHCNRPLYFICSINTVKYTVATLWLYATTAVSFFFFQHSYDLWPQKFNQIILESRTGANLKKFLFMFKRPRNIFCEATVTLPFDPWPQKSYKLIHESKWTFEPNLQAFTQGVLKIACSQGKTRGLWSHFDLDVWPHEVQNRISSSSSPTDHLY